MEENLGVVKNNFSALSLAVFTMSIISWHMQAHPHLELKTHPGLCPFSLIISMP